jgi:hypothetical protein
MTAERGGAIRSTSDRGRPGKFARRPVKRQTNAAGTMAPLTVFGDVRSCDANRIGVDRRDCRHISSIRHRENPHES